MSLRLILFLFATPAIITSCRHEIEKCGCAPAPIPSPVEFDSVFYRKTLKMKAIVSLYSQPKGAMVYLDNELIGTTPFDGIKLIPGEHKIRFEGDGPYEISQVDTSIKFDSGFTLLSIDLRKVPKHDPR
jgi:hypothetical protein